MPQMMSTFLFLCGINDLPYMQEGSCDRIHYLFLHGSCSCCMIPGSLVFCRRVPPGPVFAVTGLFLYRLGVTACLPFACLPYRPSTVHGRRAAVHATTSSSSILPYSAIFYSILLLRYSILQPFLAYIVTYSFLPSIVVCSIYSSFYSGTPAAMSVFGVAQAACCRPPISSIRYMPQGTGWYDDGDLLLLLFLSGGGVAGTGNLYMMYTILFCLFYPVPSSINFYSFFFCCLRLLWCDYSSMSGTGCDCADRRPFLCFSS